MGEIIARFEKKGLFIVGMKMMQLTDAILEDHYAHLVTRSFFGRIKASMTRTPVVVLALDGIEAIETVRLLTGATNGRKALPGTIRGDMCMGSGENIIHASDSLESAQAELARFFRPEELFDYKIAAFETYYADDEL